MRLKEILRLPEFSQVRPFISRIPSVVKFLAALATLATSIIGLVIILDSIDDPDVPEPPDVPGTPSPPTDSVLPDLLVSKVTSCDLGPPSSEDEEDVISILSLNYSIINIGVHDFEPSTVWVRAVSDHEPKGKRTTYLGEDSWVWDYALQAWAVDDNIDLPLRLTDFGEVHRITISVDSPGVGSDSQVTEDDEPNNRTVVIVDLSRKPPGDEFSVLECAPEVSP